MLPSHGRERRARHEGRVILPAAVEEIDDRIPGLRRVVRGREQDGKDPLAARRRGHADRPRLRGASTVPASERGGDDEEKREVFHCELAVSLHPLCCHEPRRRGNAEVFP